MAVQILNQGKLANKNDKYVYFIYSEEQKVMRSDLEAKMSRLFIPGKVIVNGVRKQFTELNTTGNLRYPDSVIVAQGLQSKITYTDVEIRSK